MKHLTKLILSLCIANTFAGCKENKDIANTPISNINVINAVPDVANVKVNTSGTNYSYKGSADQVAYASGKWWYAVTGSKTLIAVNALDTNKILHIGTVALNAGVYSLFLFGTTAAPDPVLKEEVNFPFIKTDIGIPAVADSVIYVRFVNISNGSPEMKVSLSTSVTVNEVESLKYKDITDWKGYGANPKSPVSYIFQFRRITDADTAPALASFTLAVNATTRFKNVMLAVREIVNATTGVKTYAVSQINYF